MYYPHDSCVPSLSSFTGKEKYNVIYSKQSKQWVVRKLYESTSQDFRKELVQQVIQRRIDKSVRLGDPAFHIHPPVSIPTNIAPTPKPNKDDLVAQHASRFLQKHTEDVWDWRSLGQSLTRPYCFLYIFYSITLSFLYLLIIILKYCIASFGKLML